ncbi:cytochrome-c peroxidase [Microbulbifer pacificus]|uniref:Cytochrome c peroxidase n=1 Tax=Microbulbifer pacificus TaxID=407164 RepID=A0AAU0N182_9GAMM|nr:cytochrome c peroxidase [Microbulbifer pacificus]WOX06078.1 cytochrome c peroxidase [Microbulbifer pacificus]
MASEIQQHGLTGIPEPSHEPPDIQAPLAQLGMQLFFTKALSGNMDTACASCHHPSLAGGDALSLSVGVEADIPDLLGPGRTHSSGGTNFDGGPTVPRNAPSTFNIVFYRHSIFLDGRIELLADGTYRTPDSALGTEDPNAGDSLSAAQARFPVTSREEMRGFSFESDGNNSTAREQLALRLRGERPELPGSHWLAAFQQGFESPLGTAEELITYDNIAAALAAYQDSQLLVDNSWLAYLDGDLGAISDEAKQGALLFLRSPANGGAGCASCHSGDFFSDEQFHVLAMPQVGRGKGNDNGETTSDDFGRFRETGMETDRYAFRTPTLLNVATTGPWGHDGAYTTLEAVIRHHLDPQTAVDQYDLNQLEASVQIGDWFANTRLALAQLQALRAAGASALPRVELADTQIAQLQAFLNTLTDPCTSNRDCTGIWVPGESLSDPDGLRLSAVDINGDPL